MPYGPTVAAAAGSRSSISTSRSAHSERTALPRLHIVLLAHTRTRLCAAVLARALLAVGGVYLLVCRSTGKQYIGSASGVGGFWARWESYFRTGHGGNEGMKLAEGSDYQVSVLEFASSSLDREAIIRMEERWKDKLLTRSFGLN